MRGDDGGDRERCSNALCMSVAKIEGGGQGNNGKILA